MRPPPPAKTDSDESKVSKEAGSEKEGLPVPVLSKRASKTKVARFRKDPRSPLPQREPTHQGWRRTVGRLFSRFTSASTGSPSDGLGNAEGGSESSASASVSRFLASQREAADEQLYDEGASWETDEVIVKGDANGLAAAAWRATGGTQTGTDTGGMVSSSGSIRAGSIASMGLTRRAPSDRQAANNRIWHLLRWRIWPYVADFFWPRFENPESEDEFQKLTWYSKKKSAAFLAIYFLINWVLYIIGNHSSNLYQEITYYGPFTFFSLITLPLVYFDLHQRWPWTFQILWVIGSFYGGFGETIEFGVCGFYSQGFEDDLRCGGKDFLALLYYSTAVPALALLTCGKRLPFLLGQIAELVLLFVFVVPDHSTFARNVVNFIIFSLFIDWLSYSQEMAARNAFILNSSLKHAYRAQQHLQLRESAAQNSKRKLTSYIFHEVRVPLNTALLAFQNLQASNAFREDRLDNDATEIHALESSLGTMSGVLNDVLDMNRLDSGRFEANYTPFPLRRSINSLMGTIRVATTAKRLPFEVEWDSRIDDLISQIPSYAAHGLNELWVLFDELRLRQVISNIASNAVKFTPAGEGRIRVRTQLLSPLPSDGSADVAQEQPPLDALVFRLEVSDGGPGIRPTDLANGRLFTPFHQTTASRLTSIKGSGLGLALVKQIITLAGGRLGVRSKKDEGSTLWFELGMRIANPEEIAHERLSVHAPLPTPPALPELILHAATHETAEIPRPRMSNVTLSGASSIALSSDLNTPDSVADSTRPLLMSHNTAPAASALKLDVPPPTINTPAAPLRPLSVLVVDDDPLTRTLMTRMLTRLGCEVDSADDGQVFLDRLLGKDGSPPRFYDVTTLDNHMPGMSGETAIRILRDAGRDDLVVGCTGNALKDDQESYLEAGISRVLTKPIMQKDLKAMLAEANARRQSSPTSTVKNADEIAVEPP